MGLIESALQIRSRDRLDRIVERQLDDRSWIAGGRARRQEGREEDQRAQ
jgi:hypothetical protein